MITQGNDILCSTICSHSVEGLWKLFRCVQNGILYSISIEKVIMWSYVINFQQTYQCPSFVVYSCQLTFYPLFTPTLPPIPIINPPPIVLAQESSAHVPFLAPSPSFSHYSSPVTPLVTVSLIFISKSLILFYSFVYFVN